MHYNENEKGHILVNLGQFKDDPPKQHVNV